MSKQVEGEIHPICASQSLVSFLPRLPFLSHDVCRKLHHEVDAVTEAGVAICHSASVVFISYFSYVPNIQIRDRLRLKTSIGFDSRYAPFIFFLRT